MSEHRYWRVTCTSTYGIDGTYWVPGKIELRGEPGGPNLVDVNTGTASADVNQSGLPVYAFDGNPDTLWYSSSVDWRSRWIQWDFGPFTPRHVSVLTIVTRKYSGSGYDAWNHLRTGYLSYSDDGENWTEAITIPDRALPGYEVAETFYPPGYSWASVNIPIPLLLGKFGGHGNIQIPAPSIDIRSGASAAVAIPMLTVSAHTGAVANVLLPGITAQAYGHDATGERYALITLPPLVVFGASGGVMSLRTPSPIISATGTVSMMWHGEITTPMLTIEAYGTVPYVGDLKVVTPPQSILAYGGASGSVTLRDPTVTGTGIAGGVGRVSITTPMLTVQASGTVQNYGSAYIVLPALRMGGAARGFITTPMVTVTAIGTAVVAVTYEAYAVTLPRAADAQGNAAPAAVTRYTNYPFDYVVRYRNSYFGANASGLYLLEGTTDDGTAIPFAVQTHLTDFKTPNLKTVASAYFSGHIGAAETISLTAGENNPITHSFTTPRGTKAQNHRQKFGLGTKARYFSLGVSGTQQFELDAVELDVTTMTRRI